jgi:hypothetical protein
LRSKAITGVVHIVLVAALIGCGGGSKSDDGGSSGGAPANAANSPAVKKLLKQTFGANPKATSGMLSGTVDIVVKGIPRYRQPIQITMSGPFNKPGGSAPEANLSVALSLRDGSLGGELILVGDEALIGLGTTAYKIPDSITATIRRPLANSSNGLASVLNVFGIAPQRWAKNPRIVGNENVSGEDTIHGTAQIDTNRFFLDVARLTKLLTALRITEVTGLPRAVDRRARGALARSVTKATGDVYSGAQDHVLRKALFDMRLKMSAKDRKTLGGISSLTIKGQLDVTDVGSAPDVSAPKTRGSYDALQITLDALAESVR